VGIDTGATISDAMAVTVERDVDDQEETWAVVPDAKVRATVADPESKADVDTFLTDCIVILTQL
jgi:hypothetical protein